MKNLLLISLLSLSIFILANCSEDEEMDTTAPTVLSINPSDGADLVAVTTTIQIIFSEAVDPQTVNNSSITTRSSSGLVTGTFSIDGDRVTFTPGSALDFDSDYTITVSSGVTDLAGNAAGSTTSSFTTMVPPDTEAPRITSIDPANNASDVAINTEINITFSEEIRNATSSTITLSAGNNTVNGTVSSSGNMATFSPGASLEEGTLYTVTVSGVEDLAGNENSSFPSRFTTEVSDDIRPTIVSTSPVRDEQNVRVNNNITITFSEAIDPATVSTANFRLFQLRGPDITAPVSLSRDGRTVIMNPVDELRGGNTTYVVDIRNGVADLAGNQLEDPLVYSFVTFNDPVAPPVLVSAKEYFAIGDNIVIRFQEPIDPESVSVENVFIRRSDRGFKVNSTLEVNGRDIIINPRNDIDEFENTFVISVQSTVLDLNGNRMAGDFSSLSFTTETISERYFYTLKTGVSSNNNRLIGNVNAPFNIGYSEDQNFCNNAWKFRRISNRTYSITHDCPPTAQFLEGGPINGTSSMAPPAANGGLFTGQIWILEDDKRQNAASNSFRLYNRNHGVGFSLDGTSPVGMRRTGGSAINQFWRLTRR